ncbi:hypothetical protein [Paenibacillus hexagrammi]|uniref:Uncharacterized protein n=1 Tax=Paenibacillus hexagrammi TaxID=2908839 RepID=A0ABY3SGE3_9BACL|nr:hypothetical protein [Paenibacillus sp. YPD9-1]UJF32996.1 hypothetical protein L0M14_26035 [Paenibacillus sp. YPD9-1]
MKAINKKILAGTIAASFVLGVGFVGSLHNQAFAATDSTSTTAQTQKTAKNGSSFGGFGNHGDRGGRMGGSNQGAPAGKGMGGMHGGNLLKEAATILGTDESSLQTSLQGGQTLLDLATAAGLSEDDFVAKLVAAETTSINAQVTAGTLTQDQADKLTADLATRIKNQVENKGFAGKNGGFSGAPGASGGKGMGGRSGGNLLKEAATILGTDESTLQTSLQGGQSLLDLATAAGLSEDDFLAKLTAAETASINEQVTAGTLTQTQADQMISDLSTRLKQRIENAGIQGGKDGQGHGGKGFGFGGFESLTTILGITQDELKTQLDAGKSVAEVASAQGISEDDLISKLKDSMNDKLKQFVEDKHQKPAAPASGAETGDSTAAVN